MYSSNYSTNKSCGYIKRRTTPVTIIDKNLAHVHISQPLTRLLLARIGITLTPCHNQTNDRPVTVNWENGWNDWMMEKALQFIFENWSVELLYTAYCHPNIWVLHDLFGTNLQVFYYSIFSTLWVDLNSCCLCLKHANMVLYKWLITRSDIDIFWEIFLVKKGN